MKINVTVAMKNGGEIEGFVEDMLSLFDDEYVLFDFVSMQAAKAPGVQVHIPVSEIAIITTEVTKDD